MAATLAQYESMVRATVAAYVDIASWPVEVIDEGLRLALAAFSRVYPPVETDFTVVTPGRQQNLATVPDILEVVALAWPWVSDGNFNGLVVNWRRLGDLTVYIESGAPAASDKIRVRHTRRYRIQNLDGAVATTVPDVAERIVVVGGAAHALLLRQRVLTENPAVPRDAIDKVQKVGEDLLKQFTDSLNAQRAGSLPAWANVGL